MEKQPQIAKRLPLSYIVPEIFQDIDMEVRSLAESGTLKQLTATIQIIEQIGVQQAVFNKVVAPLQARMRSISTAIGTSETPFDCDARLTSG